MKKKYKILQIVETLDAIGGMERIVAEIATYLNREDFAVEIWCVHRAGRYAKQLREQGLVVKEFNIDSYYNPLNILKLALEFRRSKADIVHTHMYFASTIGRCAGKFAGINVLINHVHSSYWHFTSRNLFIERMLSKITDRIICVSKYTEDFVINYEKVEPAKVEVIYNGITGANPFIRIDARQAFNIAPDDIIIITVANFLENKGHKVLFKALSMLKIQNKNVKCWLVGQGPLENQLKEYSRQLDLDSKLVFWGERYDVPQMLAASDIFVLASIQREGLSISILEALAYQVPVIATKVGGVPEVIDDKINGILVAPNEPAALAAAIDELITNRQMRQQYAQAGASSFNDKFESKKMISRIEKLYKECLKVGL